MLTALLSTKQSGNQYVLAFSLILQELELPDTSSDRFSELLQAAKDLASEMEFDSDVDVQQAEQIGDDLGVYRVDRSSVAGVGQSIVRYVAAKIYDIEGNRMALRATPL